MKVVFAPDKFAGTLTAAEAAEAMAAGWRRIRPDDELVQRPMADGGEGTVAVVRAARPDAHVHHSEVADARGLAVEAAWLTLPSNDLGATASGPPGDRRSSGSQTTAGPIALIEAAEACGLSRLPQEDRDPMRLTSYGVGQLLMAARERGAGRIVVGLGGSATVDGGAGAATALGHRLLRADGNGLKVGGGHLIDIHALRPGPPLQCEVVVAVDVTNPLLGDEGAAPVFGPQKGAGPGEVRDLAAGLERWADVVERDLDGGPWRDVPGAGAAGGLGFALAAFAGATLESGAQVIAGLVHLDEALEEADLVVTGEGSLDAQTGSGKAPEYVRRRAVELGAGTAAIAGRIATSAAEEFDVALDLGAEGMSRARELVTERAGQLAARFTTERRG